MRDERQVSWSAGELSPKLWGRTDLPIYAHGAKKLRNRIVEPHGPIARRTGTQLARTAPSGLTTGRLVPFIYDDTDNVILFFYNLRVRPMGPEAADPRHEFEWKADALATPYQDDHLHTLRFAQLGNRLTIVSPHYRPRVLIRDGASWSLEEIRFQAVISAPYIPAIEVTSGANDGTVIQPSPKIEKNPNLAIGGDADFLAREWKWCISYVVKDANGVVFETEARSVSTYYTAGSQTPTQVYQASGIVSTNPLPNEVAVHPDRPLRVWTGWFPKNKPLPVPGFGVNPQHPSGDLLLVASRIYRGREGQFGFVGQTDDEFFIDDGHEPDWTTPPRGRQGLSSDPFAIYDMETGAITGYENPSSVTYFEGRLYLGGSPENPQRLWASAVDDFTRFDVQSRPVATSPIQTDLAHDSKAVAVRALVPSDNGLLAFTSSDEFRIEGAVPGAPIVPTDLVRARNLNTRRGCGGLHPLTIGSDVIWMEAKSVKPRVMRFTKDGAVERDVSFSSRHLFEGFTIVSWDYAEDPHGIIVAARSDGALLTCTWAPEQSVVAWTRHDIADAGEVVSVACKPEGSEDGVYLLVKRDDTFTIERLAYSILPGLAVDAIGDQATPDVRYAIYLDRSKSYNGKREDVTITITDNGDGWAIGETVALTFSGAVSGLAGKVLQVDAPDGSMPVRVTVLSGAGTSWLAQVADVQDVPEWAQGVAFAVWFVCATSVTGVSWLGGREVVALADGNVVEGTVTGGAFTFPTPAAVAHVGLTFPSEWQSLDSPAELFRQKSVVEVGIELEHSRGGHVGASLEGPMVEGPAGRTVAHGYLPVPPLRTKVPVLISDTWGLPGQVATRIEDPLPNTILGITRKLAHGGR